MLRYLPDIRYSVSQEVHLVVVVVALIQEPFHWPVVFGEPLFAVTALVPVGMDPIRWLERLQELVHHVAYTAACLTYPHREIDEELQVKCNDVHESQQ